MTTESSTPVHAAVLRPAWAEAAEWAAGCVFTAADKAERQSFLLRVRDAEKQWAGLSADDQKRVLGAWLHATLRAAVDAVMCVPLGPAHQKQWAAMARALGLAASAAAGDDPSRAECVAVADEAREAFAWSGSILGQPVTLARHVALALATTPASVERVAQNAAYVAAENGGPYPGDSAGHSAAFGAVRFRAGRECIAALLDAVATARTAHA